jgi:pyruvate dehydrogenase E2 component (dihydrolipoamide acetyltransferase)
MATEVLVPPLGQTVDTVTLVTWYKSEGENVAQGEPLFAIETDKATLDIESPASGVLRGVTAQPGDEVKVLGSIAVILASDEADDSSLPPARPRLSKPDTAAVRPDPVAEDRIRRQSLQRVFISPRARRLAEDQGVPLSALKATGPEGAIIERDVRTYLDAQAAPSTEATLITPVARRMAEEAGLEWRSLVGSGPGGRVTRDDVAKVLQAASEMPISDLAPPSINEAAESTPLRSVRAVIAERMLHSATQAAQVTLTSEADATALVELRDHLIQDGIDAAFNDLFLYVLGRALREYPQLNASLEEDTINVWRRIHVGVAVDAERGLLVPVVRDVDQKGLLQLSQETGSLIERAQTGRCTPDELTGGTFTLTNLGMFGVDAFTPLINLPECAILGVGRIKRQPVMIGDEVIGRYMVWLSLTFDHRLVDGGPAARFLRRVAQLVERPHLLIT